MGYIDKDALVAEIEKRLETIACALTENNRELSAIRGAQQYELINLIQYIDTLEVKEVDLKLTLEDVSMIRQIIFDYNRQVRNEMSIPNDEEYCKEVLKRFKARKGEEV